MSERRRRPEGLRRARPWGGGRMVHPDTGERVDSLLAWAEIYDPATGGLLATFVDPTPESIGAWSRRRPVGSAHRAVIRCASRIHLRLDVRVLDGGRVLVERKEVAR